MSGNGKKVGAYRQRKESVDEITVTDFWNPWNFFLLFMSAHEVVVRWLQRNGWLKMEGSKCEHCDGLLYMKKRASSVDGLRMVCNANRNHVMSIRKHSWFERSHLTIQDIMLFMRTYLLGLSLRKCSIFAGISYGKTAVDWASFIRELFKEHFYRNTMHCMLEGEIEIDESLFGRKIKYHRGNPNVGYRIWIFGLVQRSNNRMILYPVEDRSEATLVPIIRQHVKPGSTIYSDGWMSYVNLNEMGYKHFTVIHKYAFKCQYRNVETGEIVTCHTNRVEGAWGHAKLYFRKMSGTSATQFEGHLCEIMWRSRGGDLFERLQYILHQVYPLDQPPNYTYAQPLFGTYGMEEAELNNTTIVPEMDKDEVTKEDEIWDEEEGGAEEQYYEEGEGGEEQQYQEEGEGGEDGRDNGHNNGLTVQSVAYTAIPLVENGRNDNAETMPVFEPIPGPSRTTDRNVEVTSGENTNLHEAGPSNARATPGFNEHTQQACNTEGKGKRLKKNPKKYKSSDNDDDNAETMPVFEPIAGPSRTTDGNVEVTSSENTNLQGAGPSNSRVIPGFNEHTQQATNTKGKGKRLKKKPKKYKSSDSDDDIFNIPRRRQKSMNVCCPKGFKMVKKTRGHKEKWPSLSSDDDFM